MLSRTILLTGWRYRTSFPFYRQRDRRRFRMRKENAIDLPNITPPGPGLSILSFRLGTGLPWAPGGRVRGGCCQIYGDIPAVWAPLCYLSIRESTRLRRSKWLRTLSFEKLKVLLSNQPPSLVVQESQEHVALAFGHGCCLVQQWTGEHHGSAYWRTIEALPVLRKTQKSTFILIGVQE